MLAPTSSGLMTVPTRQQFYSSREAHGSSSPGMHDIGGLGSGIELQNPTSAISYPAYDSSAAHLCLQLLCQPCYQKFKTRATTMADKFPELEGVDSTDVGDSGDFLKREKELLGNEFATEQDKIAEDDDDFEEFKSQFPEVSTNANDVAPVAESEEEPKEAIFEEPVTNKFANLNLEESIHIQEWRKARELEIAKRDELAAKKLEEIKKEAEKAIDDFYENYNNKKEEAVEATRREEVEFLEKRDSFLERGTVWDRVVELLSLTKNSNASDLAGYRDKSKFRDLLMSLKGKEDVPGAAGY
ncbi:hypothetical protein KL923_003053 [Ogataea haglerorum]|nr:hypothetical protein KL923_003053 [Ogataea haglerorum]